MRPFAQVERSCRICIRESVRCTTPANANMSCNRRHCAEFVLETISHATRFYPEESQDIDPSKTVHVLAAAIVDVLRPTFCCRRSDFIKVEI